MARGTRYLTFEGQFESSVLGRFRIVRGFANLQDLAEISVPYEMEDGNGAEVKGSSASSTRSMQNVLSVIWRAAINAFYLRSSFPFVRI